MEWEGVVEWVWREQESQRVVEIVSIQSIFCSCLRGDFT